MSKPKKYVKRPIVIEAMHWPEPGYAVQALSVITWVLENGGKAVFYCPDQEVCDPGEHRIRTQTLEGIMDASPGDYIIRGIKGEFYPCKPGIFEASYGEVEPECQY